MEIGSIIHGFEIINKRYSEELKGTLYEMKHLKTHAELIFLDNKADNKLFSVAFKTLPWDDTGVFHILEHSVLAGSENYPVKEPFLDLLKSSMNTFLNAMTFPDKTMYPVSSRNDQDFLNLTEVYLDAVFKPAIYKNESIFRQEGWHYELDEDGNPFYNGVVFNEMKGALGSVDGQIETNLFKYLFPDNSYGFESGGDPKSIPNLTYENFLRAHSEFYAPSNARIYLDGDVPLDRVLELIDGKYLSTFDYLKQEHEIAVQKPIDTAEIDCFYEIGKEESEEDKTQIVLGKVFTDWSDRKRITAYSLLASYLTGTNESPLKRAILEKGLAQDVEFTILDGIAQPFYAIIFRNTEKSKKDDIINVFKDVIDGICKDGIDTEELSAILNQFEFTLREPEEPQALYRNINLLSSWLYGGDALLYLENDALLKDLREKINSGFYEENLKNIADTNGMLILTMLPSKTKGDDDRKVENERVTAEYSAFSDGEKQHVKEIYDNMRLWQDTPDSPEAKASLPVLSLSDVKREPMWTDTEVLDANGVKVLFHKINTNGIIHANLFFDISDIKKENLSSLAFLTNLLSLLPTAKHTAKQLQKEIKKNIGALNFSIATVPVKNSPLEAKLYFAVKFSVLEQNIDKAVDLVLEILLESDYDRKDIIRENVLQSYESYYQSIVNNGSGFASKRTLIGTSAVGFADEQIDGYTMLCYLNDFSKDFDGRIDAYIDYIKAAAKTVFVKDRLIIGETAQNHSDSFSRIAASLPDGEGVNTSFLVEKQAPKKEVILIPAGISFAASGLNIKTCSLEYEGMLALLAQLLTFGYLWNEIRVHGGAYGVGFRSMTSGDTWFRSFRDPNPVNSENVYANTGEFIKDFVANDGEVIENYIISSIAATEELIGTSRQGSIADLHYLSDYTYEDKLRARTKLLGLKKEDLLATCEMFEKINEFGSVCIVGNEAAVSQLDDSWTVFKV